MKDLKIYFADFFPGFYEENIFLPILMKHYNVSINKENPDVVIHSIFNGMVETPTYDCKKILFLGENYRPQQFKSDFSISFDPHSETNFRLPLWQFFMLLKPTYLGRLLDPVKHENFDKFCSFTVSNPSNFLRNGIFNQLSNYKFVHSYGRYMTNDMSLQNISKDKYWRDAKDEFFNKTKHKFSIVYENTKYPYYTTEKLMDSYLNGSLGIYWGSNKIGEEFNEKSFINANKYNTSDLIKLIKNRI